MFLIYVQMFFFFASVLTEVVLDQNISEMAKMQRGTLSHLLMYSHFQFELIDFFERLLGFCPRWPTLIHILWVSSVLFIMSHSGVVASCSGKCLSLDN